MNQNRCPKLEKCPIFKKGLLYSEATGQTYKNLYCLNSERFKDCKRFIISEKTGLAVPDNILPNSSLSINEIIEKIKTG